jgi:hypothetical protein
VGQTATVNVTLKVAAAGEVVTVNTDPLAVEPTRTEIRQVIDTHEIQALPTFNVSPTSGNRPVERANSCNRVIG